MYMYKHFVYILQAIASNTHAYMLKHCYVLRVLLHIVTTMEVEVTLKTKCKLKNTSITTIGYQAVKTKAST